LAVVAASQGGKLNIPIAAPQQQGGGTVAPREALEEAERTRAGRKDAEASEEAVEASTEASTEENQQG
ncbi:MAG: hypothetical protein ACOC1F_13945, partial [Myxococcota bacterium]